MQLVKLAEELETVESNVLFLSDNSKDKLPKAMQIVSDTLMGGVPQLNRLCYDVLSFLATFKSVRDDLLIKDSCQSIETTLDFILSRISPSLVDSFAIESEQGSDWSALWLSWLDSIDSPKEADYIPSQIAIACKTNVEWTTSAIEAAAELLMIANGVAFRLCG